jgi:putative ABC transport system ATP-binding protein
VGICEIKELSKSYGSGATEVRALSDVNLTIDAGELVALSGPSGSGKTTLLNQIGCLDAPTSGDVVLRGQSTRALGSRALSKLRGETIGFIFQSFNLIPVLTAVENVELALELAGHDGDRREQATAMLAQVGLAGLENRRPNQLSGGQQQRVAIARALVKRPVLVLADEPTANLDSANGVQVVETMVRLNRELGITFVLSSHDPLVVEQARRVVKMRDGRVVADEARAGAIRKEA